MIDKLQRIINTIQEESYYYQTWLKEREKLLELYKENNKLLDENTEIKEQLVIILAKNIS